MIPTSGRRRRSNAPGSCPRRGSSRWSPSTPPDTPASSRSPCPSRPPPSSPALVPPRPSPPRPEASPAPPASTRRPLRRSSGPPSPEYRDPAATRRRRRRRPSWGARGGEWPPAPRGRGGPPRRRWCRRWEVGPSPEKASRSQEKVKISALFPDFRRDSPATTTSSRYRLPEKRPLLASASSDTIYWVRPGGPRTCDQPLGPSQRRRSNVRGPAELRALCLSFWRGDSFCGSESEREGVALFYVHVGATSVVLRDHEGKWFVVGRRSASPPRTSGALTWHRSGQGRGPENNGSEMPFDCFLKMNVSLTLNFIF